MGWAEVVIVIVMVGAVSNIARAKYGHGHHEWRTWGKRNRNRFMYVDGSPLAAENAALRDEMRGMKERIQVLERLATDDESDARRLDREIEKLRGTSATGKDPNRG